MVVSEGTDSRLGSREQRIQALGRADEVPALAVAFELESFRCFAREDIVRAWGVGQPLDLAERVVPLCIALQATGLARVVGP